MNTISLLTTDFWESCKQNKTLAYNYPSRKMAIFPNDAGQIVIVCLDDDAVVTAVEPDEIMPIIKMLIKALIEAEPIAAKLDEEYLEYQKVLDAEELIASKIRNTTVKNKIENLQK